MRTICIMNHKGGVGKTTTSVNVAAGLSRQDKKVLLIDFDPQGNIDLSLRVNSDFTLYDAIIGKVAIQRCIVQLGKNLDVITARESLTKAEHYLSTNPNARMKLKELLGQIRGYDYLLIDCPPSLGILNQNVLAFCEEVFVPTSTDFLGHDALQKMEKVVTKINETYGHNIRITKVIPTMFDKRSKICKDTLAQIKDTYNGRMTTPVRINSKLKEAPKAGKSIFKYARSSPGAKDYAAVVDSILQMEEQVEPEIEIIG